VARRRRALKEEIALDPVAEAEFVGRLARDPVFIAAQIALALKLVLVVLVFDPGIIDAFALPKSAISHATSLALAVLLAALLILYRRRVIIWSPAHIALGSLMAAYAASSVLAMDHETAFFGIWRRYLGLGQMLDDVVLYCAAVVLLPTARDLGRLAIVTLSTAGVVVLYMLAQKAGLDPVKYVEGPSAPPGTFGQPEVAGAYAAIAGATALAIGLRLEPLRYRLGLLGFAFVCLIATLLTNVRGSLIGLGFGWLAVVILVSLWPDRPRREALVALIGAAVVALVGIVATPIGARFLDLASFFGDRSAQSRSEIWATALRLVSERPVLGLGPDNFGIGYPAFRELRSVFLNPAELQNSTHNWLLHIATSSGMIGTAAFVALLAIAVILAVRLARAGQPASIALVPLAAFFGQGLVSINDLGTDWIPWLCIGLIAGTSGRRLSARSRPAYPVRFAAAAGALALAVMLAGVVLGNQRVIASDHFGRSESLIAANRGAEAVPEAMAAVLSDPRRAEYWSGLGAAFNASDQILPASAAFTEAARLKPSQPVFWGNLALMRLLVQDPRGASFALSKATAADPYDPQIRDLSARVALLLNDVEKASRDGHLAVRLHPEEPSVYEAPTLADIRLGNLREAEDMLRGGLAVIPPGPSLQIHLLLAQVLHAGKRDVEARAEIAAALAIDATNPAALQLQRDYK
jgi:putative inorganic carbon (HCO3(-)) transporter